MKVIQKILWVIHFLWQNFLRSQYFYYTLAELFDFFSVVFLLNLQPRYHAMGTWELLVNPHRLSAQFQLQFDTEFITLLWWDTINARADSGSRKNHVWLVRRQTMNWLVESFSESSRVGIKNWENWELARSFKREENSNDTQLQDFDAFFFCVIFWYNFFLLQN